MVITLQDKKMPISLISNTLTICGELLNPPEWYEFQVINNGISLGNIGGQTKSAFIKDFLEILDKKNGKRLSEISNAAYKEIVGGDDAEYLGFLVFSGYKSLFFFKEGQEIIHAVLGDSGGKMIAHSSFNIQVFHDWYRQLKAL